VREMAIATTLHGHLMPTVLSRLPELERALMRVRTSECRACAIAAGVELGPKPKLIPRQQKEAIRRRDRGDEALL